MEKGNVKNMQANWNIFHIFIRWKAVELCIIVTKLNYI